MTRERSNYWRNAMREVFESDAYDRLTDEQALLVEQLSDHDLLSYSAVGIGRLRKDIEDTGLLNEELDDHYRLLNELEDLMNEKCGEERYERDWNCHEAYESWCENARHGVDLVW